MTISATTQGIKPGVCTSTNRPAAPFDGQVIYETDTDRAMVWNGTGWVVLSTGRANSLGLDLVKTQTVGTAVSSVTVSDAFSSAYENYRIIYSGGVGSTSLYLKMTLGSSTASYYGSLYGAAYATGTTIGLGINNGADWGYAGLATSNYTMLDCDLHMPNLARNTLITSKWSFNLSSTGYSTFTGEHNIATQYTAFTITPNGGTVTGGTIRVYGYAI